ncbi:hypothetical protein KJN55_23270, partial [Salmonella enterica subsp. enterica]|uniref:hypothetical protein n=1 Tax=Salmonella enterica TaxID=28901 RepID=UPI00325B1987
MDDESFNVAFAACRRGVNNPVSYTHSKKKKKKKKKHIVCRLLSKKKKKTRRPATMNRHIIRKR